MRLLWQRQVPNKTSCLTKLFPDKFSLNISKLISVQSQCGHFTPPPPIWIRFMKFRWWTSSSLFLGINAKLWNIVCRFQMQNKTPIPILVKHIQTFDLAKEKIEILIYWRFLSFLFDYRCIERNHVAGYGITECVALGLWLILLETWYYR